MFGTIREYHSLLRKANLKAAPDKTFFFLRKVKFLGHVVSKEGLSPIASRIDDIKKLKSPESKTEVLGVLGVMGHRELSRELCGTMRTMWNNICFTNL